MGVGRWFALSALAHGIVAGVGGWVLVTTAVLDAGTPSRPVLCEVTLLPSEVRVKPARQSNGEAVTPPVRGGAMPVRRPVHRPGGAPSVPVMVPLRASPGVGAHWVGESPAVAPPSRAAARPFVDPPAVVPPSRAAARLFVDPPAVAPPPRAAARPLVDPPAVAPPPRLAARPLVDPPAVAPPPRAGPGPGRVSEPQAPASPTASPIHASGVTGETVDRRSSSTAALVPSGGALAVSTGASRETPVNRGAGDGSGLPAQPRHGGGTGEGGGRGGRSEQGAPASPHAMVDAAPGFIGGGPLRYPERARDERRQGVVRLRVHVDAEGRVDAVEVEGATGYPDLDASARETAWSWRFRPASHGGRASACWVRRSVVFRLE